MTHTDAARATHRGARVAALDGLRGVVILSVVVNHAGGLLWPIGSAYDTPVVNGLLGGGAVIVFFVVGAFIVTYGLLRDLERGTFDAWRFYLRRLVRLGAQLVLVCAAVWVASRFDRSPPSQQQMADNVLHVLTYTYNQYGEDHFFSVRSELGHLWYLSVQQQCYLLLPVLLAVLWRRPRALVAVLLVLAALVYWHRQVVLAEHGWVIASTLTTTRSDGLIWGVALAVAFPLLARVRGWGHVLWSSALVLLALKLVLPELPDLAYLGPWSIAFTAVAGVVVLAIWRLESPTRVSTILAARPLTWLGKASLAIFIWHLPVMHVVAGHTPDWRWQVRTALVLLVLAAIVVVMERWVDTPIRNLLATRPVFRVQPTPARTGEAR